MKVDPANLGDRGAYRLLSSAMVPRPIAFVSTVGPKGIYNAAPFSFCAPICAKPPTLCFSVARRDGRKKDTVVNIEYSGDFVVNIVDEELAQPMNVAATDYPPEVSEFVEAKLTPVASDKVKSPRIAEAPINMECKLVQIIEIGESHNSLIIGEVVQFHIKDEIYQNGQIDARKLKPLARLSGSLYAYIRDIFELERLSYQR